MDPQSVSRLADYVKTTFGGVDAIVNNAAIAFKGSTFGPQETRQTLETNLYGTKRVTDSCAPVPARKVVGSWIVVRRLAD